MINGISGFNDLSNKLLAAQQRQVERTQISPFPSTQQTKTSDSGVSVVLSFEAKVLSAQASVAKGNWQKTVGEHGVLLQLATQIKAFGKDAELLKEIPNSDDPAGFELAEQAKNYVLAGGENPFSGVARKTLSNIAFDESGAFTAAERFAAMSEISVRDGAFWTKNSEIVKAAQDQENYRAIDGIITQANLKVLGGMTETEKSMHSFTEDSLGIQLKNLALDIEIPIVDYENLSSPNLEVFATTRNSDVKATWSNFSLDILESNQTILDSITPIKTEGASKSESTPNNGWLTLYARISNYQD